VSGADQTGLEIAVIGMAGRFPGARTVAELWEKLRGSVDCISDFTAAELTAAGVPAELFARPDYVKAGAVLDDIDRFDAGFFGFSPREAELLDPQQRVFLECAWEALEDAGYAGEAFRGLIGVCAGTGRNGYLQQNVYTNPRLIAAAGVFQTFLNNEKDSLALRTAYLLNLGGPALTVQTACSTSLVAVHLACQSLLAGDCDICLAGGVSIALPQTTGYLYEDGLMLSPDGRCRAFDVSGSGAVLGRGAGVVVLKRLAEAVEDGDRVLAVIKGSAVNNDGSSKIGYTAPSIDGQARVIRMAHARAGVDPETVTFVEAHGTGTELGDPIEVAALNEAFGAGAGPNRCALGAVKTNIGHLDAAAGVAGLIKTVLALQHREIPPTLHFRSPNPAIDFAGGPFYVNTTLRPWSAAGPLRAGVSSFGMGGTNAHVVLEEAPRPAPAAAAHSHRLLVMSARTAEAADQAAANLASFLHGAPAADLDDVAYTLQVGRRTFEHRRACVCTTTTDAVAALAPGSSRLIADANETRERRLAFMFPGQGAQYAGMARGLFDAYPEFRTALAECCRLFARHLDGIDLLQALYPDTRHAEADSRLARTELAQPAIFAVEYALARLLMSWGLTPDAMIGHSVGEFVAACLAQVFTLEQAVGLIAARGRLMQRLPVGSMLAVPLAEHELASMVAGTPLSVAAVNGPRLSVVSGPADAVDQLAARLGDGAVRLHTSHAFHSSMMDPILDEFAELVARTRPAAPRLRFISNVTGTWITDAQAADPTYWTKHLRQPVRFADGARVLTADAQRVLLEVGPGATLVTLARQNAPAGVAPLALQTLPRPQSAEADTVTLLRAIARLWTSGVPIDFQRMHAGEGRRRVALPTYPFERKRFWVEPNTARQPAPAPRPTAIAKNSDPDEWCFAPVWKSSVGVPSPGEAAGHAWLVLARRTALHDAVIDGLRGRGAAVVRVEPGDRFERISSDRYVIDPGVRAHFDALIADIAAAQPCDRVAHLWSVGTDGEEPAARYDASFYGLLAMVQALDAARMAVSRIVVAVSGVHAVTGEEQIDRSAAAMLGLCPVIQQEYAGVSCRVVDVDRRNAVEVDPRTVTQIVAELTGEAAAAVVAYRGTRRWVQTWEQASVRPLEAATLRPHGVYIVTGGLGRVALAIADHLARTVSARLVLASRNELPPRDEWGGLVAGTDRQAERVRAIEQLERAGAEVIVRAIDVADQAQMTALVRETEARFGRVDGVVHAAGVTHGGTFAPLAELDRAACEAQFAAKIAGVEALEAALAGRRLDFCVLASSLASVLGGFRFGGYAAANRYLDAVAHAHHANGEPWWTSVNWDGWDFGDGAGSPRAIALKPAEGAAIFARVAAAGLPQVAVSVGDLPARILVASTVGKPATTGERLTSYPRPNLQNPYVAPSTAAERTIAGIWKDLLGIDAVGVNDSFFELGGHSLLATQAASALKTAFDAPIPVALIFEHPTVSALAAALSAPAPAAPAGLTRASGRGERRRAALRRLEAVE
jgi:acyl transferase domain-containing protein